MANQPKRSSVIELIVTVFDHSEARSFVGTDALRTVLEVQYAELTKTGALNLETLWQLLGDQPGFAPDATIPPMCTIKNWERHLGMEVSLPEVLDGLSDTDIADEAKKAAVPASTVKKLLGDVSGDAEKRKTPVPEKTTSKRASASDGPQGLSPKLIGAALVAVLSFGFAAYTLGAFMCTSPQFSEVKKGFAGEIPVSGAKRLGDQVGAMLTDDSWLRKPREERESDLSSALDALGPKTKVFYLTNNKGGVVASVQRAGDGLSFRLAK